MYLIAFLLDTVTPVWIWKMNVTSGLLHDFLYIVASFANNMWVISIRHIHLQCHSVYLFSIKNPYIKLVNIQFTVYLVIFVMI